MSIRAHMQTPVEQGERRNGDRLHLYLATSGTMPEGAQVNVEIHNISASGMLLETSLALHKGAKLAVDLPENGQTIASVVWAGEGIYGCAFDEPISASATLFRSASGRITMWFLAPPSACTRLPLAVPRL